MQEIDHRTFFDRGYFEGGAKRPSNYLGGYEAMGYGGGRFYAWEEELMTRHFPDGGLVIELGAATGTFGNSIARHWPDGRYKYVASDISRYALQRAKGITSRLMVDMEENSLPFRSASTQIIAAFDVLEHCRPEKANIEASIQEMGRVLEPGGLMLITLPLKGTWFKKLLEGLGIHEMDPSHIQVPNKEMIGELLKKAEENYEIVEVKYFFPMPKFKIPHIPSGVLIALKKKI